MGDLSVEVDPGEVGFDATRLGHIDRHFDAYVADGRLPGYLAVVARHGKIVHVALGGQRDKEAELPIELDTLFRIYSMTKPITSVAAMMLYEEGGFELKDPVSAFIPAFADTQVYRSGSSLNPVTEPASEAVRIWHLLSHTSGLTYGFHHGHPVDTMYRAAGFEWGSPPGVDLAGCCELWAGLPLLFQPGSEWNYGVSTDVLGRIVEVVSDQSLDVYMRERIFEPLGMVDTAFHVPETHHDRLAALYVALPAGRGPFRMDSMGDTIKRPPTALMGGGGLVSTAADYHRFTNMLLGRGETDGVRLVGSRTLDYMTRNHLPGGADLEAVGRPLFAETTFAGVGFGLGFSVVIDSVANKVLSTDGTFAWGGAASTAFWVDPVEGITVSFFTQVLPSSTYPIRSQLSQLVGQALID